MKTILKLERRNMSLELRVKFDQAMKHYDGISGRWEFVLDAILEKIENDKEGKE